MLFRGCPKNTFPEVEPELANSRLLSDHFLSTHYNTLRCLGFVNSLPYTSLINPGPDAVSKRKPRCWGSWRLRTNRRTTGSNQSHLWCGYTIALTTFLCQVAWKRFLPYVSIIKFDIRLIQLRKLRCSWTLKGLDIIKFLAEKVETYDEYQEANQAGFTYFR